MASERRPAENNTCPKRRRCSNPVAITGPEAQALRRSFGRHYVPNVLFLGCTDRSDLPLLQGKFLPNSTIFVCINKACQLPVATVHEALKQLP